MLGFVLGTMVLASGIPTSAAEPVDCFSEMVQEDLVGICVTETAGTDCRVFCGNRTICAGDILTVEQAEQMQVTTTSATDTVAEFSFLPVFSDRIGAVETLYFQLRGTEDQIPVAQDSEIETYKNIEISGTLDCRDPEGGELIYTIVRKPKRGMVTWNEDGTFTYTPKKEQVGADYFTYVAEDTAGNQSAETKVSITIMKCSSNDVFADMVGDPQAFVATFLRKNEIYSGVEIGDTRCFCPEQTVSYEEFLMMLMKLTGLEREQTTETDWFAPWQTAALRAGWTTERAVDGFDKTDAAVLTAGILDLKAEPSVTVFSDMMTRYSDYEIVEIVSPEGENVLGEKYYEFHVDEEKLDELIVRLFYAPK